MVACKDENALQPLDAETRSKVREALTRSRGILTPREERILRMRFGIGMNAEHTVDEVAQQFAITAEEVRKIEARAAQKLKDPSWAHARKAVRTEDIPGHGHADIMMKALADETVARTGTKASPTDAEK